MRKNSKKVAVIVDSSEVERVYPVAEAIAASVAEAVEEEASFLGGRAEIEALYPANLVETLFAYLPEVEDDNPKALRPYKPRLLTPGEVEAKEAFEKAREILRTAKEKAKAEREKERAEKAANRVSNGTSGRKGITRT